jgi:hypothetical protein
VETLAALIQNDFDFENDLDLKGATPDLIDRAIDQELDKLRNQTLEDVNKSPEGEELSEFLADEELRESVRQGVM